ncbi:MAG: NnrS family protein [Mariprofundaceae bacterium]
MESKEPGHNKWAPLALGFRPFFLLGIWSAALLIVISLYAFTSGWHENYFNARLWHAHEMLFGYAVAVIAGFLLTAVRNWTGLPTPSGTTLGLLLMLWLLPRILSAASLPPIAFALLDLSFLPVLASVIGRLILQAKQRRNYPIPVLLLLMGLCNVFVHLEVLGFIEGYSNQALQLTACLMIALITVIAGRVVPFFMQSATGSRPSSNAVIERLALPSVLLFAASLATASAGMIIFAALAAAVIHAVRLIRWFDTAVWRQPLLWVLHVGYAWMVAGFIIFGLSIWLDIPAAHAIHAWTIGSIGMFTMGMMARVALGHTGRAMKMLPWMKTAFTLVFVAALFRVLLPAIDPALLDSAVRISATCWISAFIITGIRYSSILLLARVDGKPG